MIFFIYIFILLLFYILIICSLYNNLKLYHLYLNVCAQWENNRSEGKRVSADRQHQYAFDRVFHNRATAFEKNHNKMK